LVKSTPAMEEIELKTCVNRRTQSIPINNLQTKNDVFEPLSDHDEIERPIFLKKTLKTTKFGQGTH
jgi:hypothetical protein